MQPDSTTVSTTLAISQEIFKRLDLLAAQLGTTAGHLWSVLVYQSLVDGITYSIGLVLAGCLVATSYRRGRAAFDRAAKSENEGDILLCLFHAAVLVIGTVVAVSLIGEIPTLFLNPEYAALQKVLDVLR